MSRNNAKNIPSKAPSPVADDIEVSNTEAHNIVPESNEMQSPAVAPKGSMLRDARVAKKLRLEDVSQHLRISVKQVEALEGDNYAALPEPVIVRGFIRNYARMLDIDAGPILYAYKLNVPELAQPCTMQSRINMPMISQDKQSWTKYVVASVLLIIGLCVWLFYVDLMSASTKFGLLTHSLAPETAAVTSVTEPLPEIALPAAERFAQPLPTEDAESSATTTSSTANAPTVAPTAGTAASPANTVMATKAIPEALASNIAATKLNFSVKEETWVNVSDANGRVIYNKTLAAGTQDSLQVQAALPIKIIVGNVNGTTFIFNGNPVDLAHYAKSNVAKFSLQ